MKAIVSLNAGSSSIKFALFAIEAAKQPRFTAGGKIEKIGIAPSLRAHCADGETLLERTWDNGADLTHAQLLADLVDWMTHDPLKGHDIAAIGHRVVHGGTQFAAPVLVNDQVMEALQVLCPLAPLHQPHNLEAIRAVRAIRPNAPQIACFDTQFHHGRPDVATRFALPRTLHDQGIRRYGFHGLSYEYIARRLREIDPALASGRVIAAHLGNGASLCAMHDGKSIDTTMGFTALDGLMMGTRCGTLDPGVVLHLQKQNGMSASDVEAMLYTQSGLLGVSGISRDMRVLAQSPAPEADEAIDLFCWRAARETSGLIPALGGLDALIFTAGIGENAPAIRAGICERLDWLGIALDPQANANNAARIESPDSSIRVLVIPTDEELMIALHTIALL